MNPNDVDTLGPELESTMKLVSELVSELQRMESQLNSLHNSGRVREIIAALRLRPNLEQLPKALLGVYSEISEALHGIRLSRETIQSYSTDRLRDTHARLGEVNSTTESAALEMLNGLDRSLQLIDRIEQDGELASGAARKEAFDSLRNEVNQLYSSLQFQDIIAQKLHGITALLADIEGRIETVAAFFDGGQHAPEPVAGELPAPGSYNPDATMSDAAARQAAADAVLSSARSHSAA